MERGLNREGAYWRGGLIERGLNREGAYWRGGLIERGLKRAVFELQKSQNIYLLDQRNYSRVHISIFKKASL